MIKLVLSNPTYYGLTPNNVLIPIVKDINPDRDTTTRDYTKIICHMSSTIEDTETHEIYERNTLSGEAFRNESDEPNNKLGMGLALSRVKMAHYEAAIEFGLLFSDSLKFITFICYIFTYYNKEKNHLRYLKGCKELTYPTDLRKLILENVQARLQPLKDEEETPELDKSLIIK